MSYHSTGDLRDLLAGSATRTAALSPTKLVSKSPVTQSSSVTATAPAPAPATSAPGLLSRKVVLWGVAVGVLAVGGAMYLRKRKRGPAAPTTETP